MGGATTACEDGKKADGGKAASAPSAQASPSASKAAGGAADATPAAFLQKTKKKSEEITSARYTLSGTTGGQQASAEVSVRFKPTPAMSMKATTQGPDGGTGEIRVIDGAMYMGSEGQWLKFDMKALDEATTKKMGKAQGSANTSGENPGDRADQLMGAKDLKTVGEENVDGVKTTHVSGTVTTDQMRAGISASAAPEARERREKSVKQLEDEGIKTLNVDMWIDESGHTKQVRTRGEGTKGPLDTTIKFLDFNKPVEITAPPADQVVDLAEMMKRSREGSGTGQG
ncbi:LppX_LprAFG lipoprotein [Streptomyces sp. WAC07149]|nr:LppX_LprAFG lipoprotein [Streptomyces sp. WAC07149]